MIAILHAPLTNFLLFSLNVSNIGIEVPVFIELLLLLLAEKAVLSSSVVRCPLWV